MSSFGTFIIVCYTGLGLGLVGLLHYFIRKWRWRWVVSTPLLLGLGALAVAPYLEEAHIAAQYEELCKDAGIHVKRKVEARGYFNSYMAAGYSEMERRSWDFMEHYDPIHRKIEHFERIDGQLKRSVIDRPTARYHLKESRANSPIGHRITVNETVIVDSQAGEVIARQTIYHRIANTVDQAWMGMIGSTLQTCYGKGPPASLVDETIDQIKP
jgi:hypothetical protein